MTNAGNITLTNVLVLNRLSGVTPIFTAASLAPGTGAGFTGSYLTPNNCSTTSTSTAIGTSACGIAITNSATSTCSILTTPAILVTLACPATPVYPGGLLTYSGSVSNAGNITLTNIIVLSDMPAANTTVFTANSLAPGAVTNFSGSYATPPDCCVVWNTLDASGQGCSGVTVTDEDTTPTAARLAMPAMSRWSTSMSRMTSRPITRRCSARSPSRPGWRSTSPTAMSPRPAAV